MMPMTETMTIFQEYGYSDYHCDFELCWPWLTSHRGV